MTTESETPSVPAETGEALRELIGVVQEAAVADNGPLDIITEEFAPQFEKILADYAAEQVAEAVEEMRGEIIDHLGNEGGPTWLWELVSDD